MVAPLILARDNNGDLHDQEGHLRNAAGQRIDAQGLQSLSLMLLLQLIPTDGVGTRSTKDEINEMSYGVYGEHEKNKEAFQMKLDGVYYPLNDSLSFEINFFFWRFHPEKAPEVLESAPHRLQSSSAIPHRRSQLLTVSELHRDQATSSCSAVIVGRQIRRRER
ncbi:hypothetical protein Bca52824_087355 [Brassica carinata]|uniref:Uncharacterized protein n=1 Tax=Brassica carinata TaxID=52824 RepID=A0A8X7TMV7_BRACI|nr:hypothetical protein Bca52824_087355 [Brassica carinata]